MRYLHIFEKYGGKVRGSGKWYRIKCPFHKDTDASLDIDLNKSGFNCFGCGASGNHIDLIMQLEKVSRASAERILSLGASRIRSNILGDYQSEEVAYLDDSLLEKFVPIQGDVYIKYLKLRKIDLKIAKKYDIRQGSIFEKGWQNRIIYGIRNYWGDLCSIEGRTITDNQNTLRYRKWTGSKSSRGLFGIEKFNKKKMIPHLFVVEGVFDALSVISCGYNAVAMNCSEITGIQLVQLRKVTDCPIILYDGAKKGTRIERDEVIKRAKKLLSGKFVRYDVIEIPNENRDPNDLHKKGKLKDFLKRVIDDGKKGSTKSKGIISTGENKRTNKKNIRQRI